MSGLPVLSENGLPLINDAPDELPALCTLDGCCGGDVGPQPDDCEHCAPGRTPLEIEATATSCQIRKLVGNDLVFSIPSQTSLCVQDQLPPGIPFGISGPCVFHGPIAGSYSTGLCDPSIGYGFMSRDLYFWMVVILGSFSGISACYHGFAFDISLEGVPVEKYIGCQFGHDFTSPNNLCDVYDITEYHQLEDSFRYVCGPPGEDTFVFDRIVGGNWRVRALPV